MWFPVIAGLLIGIFVQDWLGRLVLPLCVGLIEFIHYCVVMHRDPMHGGSGRRMRKAGVSEDEIQDVIQGYESFERRSIEDAGLTLHRFRAFQYAMAFIHPAVTALTLSIAAGVLTSWLL